MVLDQLHPQLLWPSVRPALAQSQHRLHHCDVMRLTVLHRRVRALRQTRGAFRDIPPEPLVAGLPADPVLTAQHRHLILARQNPSDKLHSLVHGTGRFPRHRQVPPAGSSNLSPIHPVNSVTNLLGPYTSSPSPRGRGEGRVRSLSFAGSARPPRETRGLHAARQQGQRALSSHALRGGDRDSAVSSPHPAPCLWLPRTSREPRPAREVRRALADIRALPGSSEKMT